MWGGKFEFLFLYLFNKRPLLSFKLFKIDNIIQPLPIPISKKNKLLFLYSLTIASTNNSVSGLGIKVALLTTVFGLITAIILQLFYNYIIAKIDSIVNAMEDASISLIDLLSAQEKKKALVNKKKK